MSLYRKVELSVHDAEALETALNGVAMDETSRIDWCTFKKLPDLSPGKVERVIRYNVYDQFGDTYIGHIEIQKRTDAAGAQVAYQYHEKHESTFEKIRQQWDKFVRTDAALSNLIIEKREATLTLTLDDSARGKYGTDRNLSLADVKNIVKQCKAYIDNDGKVTDFYRQFSHNKYSLDTLRDWLKDRRFTTG